jgi:hypothetical protein
LSAAARATLTPANARAWSGTLPTLDAESLASAYAQHQALHTRLNLLVKRIADEYGEAVERKDLAAIFPGGYKAREVNGEGEGVLFGYAEDVMLLGLVDKKPVTAQRAWAFAERVWEFARAPKAPKQLQIVIDCEAHSTSMDDEKIMLSSYIANVGLALAALAKRGTFIETTVLGVLGGGIYVAVAAASVNVNLLHGAHIQLLPGRAIASILGSGGEAQDYELADYQKALVAEKELRVGYLRESK